MVPIQQEIDLGEPKFDDFWLLWLKKVKRKEAERLFLRLRDEQKMLAIVAAAEWRPLWLERGDEYAPDPVKWLEGDRWEDQLPGKYQRAQAHVPMKPRAEDTTKYVPMPDHVKQLLAKLKGGK